MVLIIQPLIGISHRDVDMLLIVPLILQLLFFLINLVGLPFTNLNHHEQSVSSNLKSWPKKYCNKPKSGVGYSTKCMGYVRPRDAGLLNWLHHWRSMGFSSPTQTTLFSLFNKVQCNSMSLSMYMIWSSLVMILLPLLHLNICIPVFIWRLCST